MNFIEKTVRLGWQVLKIALLNPARLSHVFGTALAASEEVADRDTDLLRFPCATVEDLVPENGDPIRAVLALFPKTNASISMVEFICLILLLKKAKATRVFEFGTYKGVSITQIALNLPPDSRILTLDLPEDQSQSLFSISDPEDAVIAFEKGKGALVPADLRPRIEFLKQDSAQFDESPLVGEIDFVFVDGAHNAEYVRNDSEKGWRMLRAGGIIAWHDCRVADPAVVRYLLQSSFKPVRVLGTSLAFATKAPAAKPIGNT